MFGAAKPAFGTTTNTGFAFNNTANASPFGQSAFGKPATTAFGAAPSFGAQQTTPSMFGGATAQPQTTGLFGGASTSSTFGTTANTQPAFGGFQQTAQNTSIFGANQPATNSISLFSQPTSAFSSAVKPGGLGTFGQTATQPTSSLFGAAPTAASTTGFGTFGQTAATTTNVFGSSNTSAFGQPAAANAANAVNAGTSIAKYQPTVGTDTLMKGGQPNNVNTKQHCITAMKEYESKSLEELRMEDYLANRKGMQAGSTSFFGASVQQPTTGTGLFGNTTQPSTGLFGQTNTAAPENKSLFGSSAFGQPATSAFGATQQQNNFLNKPFGAAPTNTFGSTTTDGANPFGAKPAFGQTSAQSLFGQPAASTANTFASGFGGFGSNANTQPNSLFGSTTTDANKPAFGLGSTANTGFGGFGSTTTSTASTGPFASKPATGFGTTVGFGATSTANTGFPNFSMNNSSGGIFNSSMNKPAATGFGGFGAQSSAPSLNFNAGSANTSLFSQSAAKPGFFGSGLSNNTNTTGTGLFGGTTNTFGGGSTLSSSFGANTLGGGSGAPLMGFGGTPQQHQQVPIHQLILSKVTSPYGDNPIYKDLQRNDEVDATRATNPSAQKAILEASNNSSQFKVTAKASPVLKIKPAGAATKKSLFDGLEENDPSVESFALKPNAKRLVLKPKQTNNSMIGAASPLATGNSNSANNSFVAVESFSSDVRKEGTPTGATGAAVAAKATGAENAPPNLNQPRDSDAGRRESWLHPCNLEKVRQHNMQTVANSSPLNSTVNELVPRKPLETYRPGRPSVSTVMENTFEEQSAGITARSTTFGQDMANDSLFGNRSYDVDEPSVLEEVPGGYEEHPTGITLRRVGYYTIPSLEDLKSYIAEDGSCVVPNFTIGREGYGNVYFAKEMDVAGLNLDDIVHFRNKEVIIYPDDDNKPPIGSGLNREAQVTLDQVWPIDKTKHEPVKDAERLAKMDWEGKLRRVCEKNETRFIEYRPETGSWVFRVKHFSKYGLNESDEEEEVPTDPKKQKMATVAPMGKQALQQQQEAAGVEKITLDSLKKAQKLSEEAARAVDPKALAAGITGNHIIDESAEFMLLDKTQFFQAGSSDSMLFEQYGQLSAPAVNVTSPTTTLAKNAGTDSHKLQLMKASFFLDEDIDEKAENAKFARQSRITGILGRRKQDMPFSMWKDTADCAQSNASSTFDYGSTAQAPSSAASVISLIRETQTESSSPFDTDSNTLQVLQQQQALRMPAFVIRPKVAPIKSLAVQLPYNKSVSVALQGKWAADLGLYNSRYFKVGFGAQNTLIVPTTHNNSTGQLHNVALSNIVSRLFQQRGNNDYSTTLLQYVKISSTQYYENFKGSIQGHLEIQLKYVKREEVVDSECPWLHSDHGAELIAKHLDEAIKLINNGELEEYAVSVWSLCLALWGEHEDIVDHEPTSHYAVMARRNLLSDWLENTLTDKDLLNKHVTKNSYLSHLMELIMCHKVTEACELAFMHDDANLALLMSQLSSGPLVRQLMQQQLQSWHTNKADKFIDTERLKMFMLLASVPVMASAHGPLNVLEGLLWIKTLALQLWYLCSPTSSITDALLAYDESFQSAEMYALPPSPAYVDNSLDKSCKPLYDMRYHLLQLYSKRSHPLESLLNPATHTADPMDFRLSWLLLQTLEALGYRHISELSESQLHVGFASQLENNDMWEWAIFVLLHIKERNQREIAVQNILYRYVSISADVALNDKEKFVINNLGVPEKWIDYAKAVKAGAENNYAMQAKYLLKAKQWSLAHEVIFKHIAPDAVINDKLDYLHGLLSQFEQAHLNKGIKVPNWANQGQIFLDFIDISEKFKGLKTLNTEADIQTHWENLKPQLADLCSRINLLPCPTAKHRLCQSEIAQNLACLIRGVLVVCPVLNPCLIIKIALERLPLPQEFAQQELRALLDALLEDLSKIKTSTEDEDNNKHLTKDVTAIKCN